MKNATLILLGTLVVLAGCGKSAHEQLAEKQLAQENRREQYIKCRGILNDASLHSEKHKWVNGKLDGVGEPEETQKCIKFMDELK